MRSARHQLVAEETVNAFSDVALLEPFGIDEKFSGVEVPARQVRAKHSVVEGLLQALYFHVPDLLAQNGPGLHVLDLRHADGDARLHKHAVRVEQCVFQTIEESQAHGQRPAPEDTRRGERRQLSSKGVEGHDLRLLHQSSNLLPVGLRRRPLRLAELERDALQLIEKHQFRFGERSPIGVAAAKLDAGSRTMFQVAGVRRAGRIVAHYYLERAIGGGFRSPYF